MEFQKRKKKTLLTTSLFVAPNIAWIFSFSEYSVLWSGFVHVMESVEWCISLCKLMWFCAYDRSTGMVYKLVYNDVVLSLFHTEPCILVSSLSWSYFFTSRNCFAFVHVYVLLLFMCVCVCVCVCL